MTLYTKLQSARTEEDVKAAYVKALGLKNYSMNITDIQTDEVWFEAKINPTPIPTMFAQLLFYVREARAKSEPIPPFLAVIDREKAALMQTSNALPVFDDKKIKWAKNASEMASDKGKTAVALIKPYIEAHFTTFHIEEDEKEFIAAVKNAIAEGKIIRTPITPDNLKQVFDKWVEMVGREMDIKSEADYALLFYADIMFDPSVGKTAVADLPVRLLMDGEKPVFVLNGKNYDLASERGHSAFWRIYHRPPEKEHRQHLLERRDVLIPLDERSFKGAFYTPLKVVDKAYDLLAETLGKNWQEKYIVWDPCCGVGNLEVKHSNPRNVFMSTLDQADIDVMKASKTCAGAMKFQYDYLNDDVNEDGEIDYSLTNKMPLALRQAINDAKSGKKGAKKILILMNPPYAEATSGDTVSGGENKTGVAKTKFAKYAMAEYGKASNELSTQFISRIHQEIPNAQVATFSKMGYICAPTLNEFRLKWQPLYLGGFVVHSKSFEGLSGDFPIGFLIWDTSKKNPIIEIKTKIINKESESLGFKVFYSPSNTPIMSEWVKRPLSNNLSVVPLKNAINTATSSKDVRGIKWSDGAIAWLNCAGNEPQNANNKTMLFSSGYGSARGFFVTKINLWQAAIIFAVRRVIKPTWLNDRDQFLQPTAPLSEEFKNDCLIYMLFSGSNLTASANDLEWNGKTWNIVNHFIPFTETEVDANGRFESDFMVQYLRGKKFSAEAKAVFMAGREIWKAYHRAMNEKVFNRNIRDEYKLNRADVGWYQIRKAIEAQEKETGEAIADFVSFKTAFANLTQKLIPQVYDLGFLK